MTSILGYEPKIQRLLDANWIQFKRFAETKEPIDMEKWAQYFAYDVVSELALGRAIGMVKAGNDVNDYMMSVLGNFWFASNLGHLPGQRKWLNNPVSQFLIQHFGSDSMKGTYKFRKFVGKAVGDRYYSNTKPDVPDMLQHFIEAKDRDGSPQPFGDVIKESANVRMVHSRYR